MIDEIRSKMVKWNQTKLLPNSVNWITYKNLFKTNQNFLMWLSAFLTAFWDGIDMVLIASNARIDQEGKRKWWFYYHNTFAIEIFWQNHTLQKESICFISNMMLNNFNFLKFHRSMHFNTWKQKLRYYSLLNENKTKKAL